MRGRAAARPAGALGTPPGDLPETAALALAPLWALAALVMPWLVRGRALGVAPSLSVR
jgi:hypothetical protein